MLNWWNGPADIVHTSAGKITAWSLFHFLTRLISVTYKTLNIPICTIYNYIAFIILYFRVSCTICCIWIVLIIIWIDYRLISHIHIRIYQKHHFVKISNNNEVETPEHQTVYFKNTNITVCNFSAYFLAYLFPIFHNIVTFCLTVWH